MSNMDVNTTTRVAAGYMQYAAQSTTAKNSLPQTQNQSNTANIGEAFDIDISAAAKQAQAAAQEDSTVENDTQTKGLTAEQVRYLEESMQVNQQTMLNMMIQALTESNDKLQGWLDEGVGILNFDGVQIDASRFALPEVATNPQDAAKAIADGGEWSIDAVSTRIFDMATAIAGNDPEKLSAMRAAVEEGFKQAGLAWTDATGLQNMPDITKNTYDEIMSRFDARTNEINGTSVVE